MSGNEDAGRPEPAGGPNFGPPIVDAGLVDASFDYAGHAGRAEPKADGSCATGFGAESNRSPDVDGDRSAAPDEGEQLDEDETVLIDGKTLRGTPPAESSRQRPDPGAAAPAPASAPTRVGWARRRAPAPPRHPHAKAGAVHPPSTDPGANPPLHGVRILVRAVRRPRAKGTHLMIALLCGLLGFFAVVQVRLQSGSGTLRNARQSDLIRILDDLNDRSDRLTGEINDLESRRAQLQSGTNSAKAALAEALKRKSVLGILSGTVPAHGPGITLQITDPQKKVDAAVLLDALEELRDAGAEAVEINSIRVVAATSFLDAGAGQVRIDTHLISSPYVFEVIGDPDTLDPALRIPGGVFAVLEERGATTKLQSAQDVAVDAVRPAAPPQYAKPVAPGS